MPPSAGGSPPAPGSSTGIGPFNACLRSLIWPSMSSSLLDSWSSAPCCCSCVWAIPCTPFARSPRSCSSSGGRPPPCGPGGGGAPAPGSPPGGGGGGPPCGPPGGGGGGPPAAGSPGGGAMAGPCGGGAGANADFSRTNPFKLSTCTSKCMAACFNSSIVSLSIVSLYNLVKASCRQPCRRRRNHPLRGQCRLALHPASVSSAWEPSWQGPTAITRRPPPC